MPASPSRSPRPTHQNPSNGPIELDPRLQNAFIPFAVAVTSAGLIMTALLDNHVTRCRFSAPVTKLVPTLVESTLSLHAQVAATFQQSNLHFMYGFTARHLLRVVGGLCMATAQEFNSTEKMACLWYHEVFDVLHCA